jgi:SsrA-binding protein
MTKSSKSNTFVKNLNITNRKANFDYYLHDTYTAGIVLQGTEIKSIRMGKASLVESYCHFRKGELWIKNMNISQYEKGNIYNHDPQRERKLLLSRKELNKLIKNKEKGFTIIPTKLFISKRGFAKLEIALAKGKKLYDKRQVIKERDLKRESGRLALTSR